MSPVGTIASRRLRYPAARSSSVTAASPRGTRTIPGAVPTMPCPASTTVVDGGMPESEVQATSSEQRRQPGDRIEPCEHVGYSGPAEQLVAKVGRGQPTDDEGDVGMQFGEQFAEGQHPLRMGQPLEPDPEEPRTAGSQEAGEVEPRFAEHPRRQVEDRRPKTVTGKPGRDGVEADRVHLEDRRDRDRVAVAQTGEEDVVAPPEVEHRGGVEEEQVGLLRAAHLQRSLP